MRPLSKLSKEDITNVELLIFDVDGILVKRGTKIEKKRNRTIFRIKKVNPKTINLLKKIYEGGYKINISSGRSLSVLKEMFNRVLGFVSITYENGSATWLNGKIYPHVKRYHRLEELHNELKKVKNSKIKGFEPKEYILTLHSRGKIKKVESIVKKYNELYYIWNSEAYDIGIKSKQTKLEGLKNLLKILNINKKEVLFVGDNYNDQFLSKNVNLIVSADKNRLKGQFFVKLSEKNLPGDEVMKKLLNVRKKR